MTAITLDEAWERFPSAQDIRPQYSVCAAAEKIHTLLATIHLYEMAGLLLPHLKVHCLYSNDDLRWIRCISYLHIPGNSPLRSCAAL